MKPALDHRDHKKFIEEVINRFYEAYYTGNTLELYSLLDTGFQKRFPLNYFLVHERFQQPLGVLVSILSISVEKEENFAAAEILVEDGAAVVNRTIQLEMDYGGWKLAGDIFH